MSEWLFIEETEDKDLGDPLSLDEIFSPHFAVRHFDSTWIEGNKRKHSIVLHSYAFCFHCMLYINAIILDFRCLRKYMAAAE